jgi:hypothetical protein
LPKGLPDEVSLFKAARSGILLMLPIKRVINTQEGQHPSIQERKAENEECF